MEMLGKLYNRIKKYQAPSERFLFPLILLLWPLTGIAQGVDLADSTYALGNYRFLAGSGSTWDVATFLANRLGAFLLKLPGGGTLRGMNLWTSLLVSALALMVYFVMQRFMPGWMLFVGEMLAVSLCWCPGVILYNYLTYFLLTAACLMLFLGISSVPEKNSYFVFAGILLGLNLFVRFSNLTQAALILAVWFHTFITLQKSTKLIPRTLSCMGGYLIGAGIGMAAVTAAYGPTAFADMVRGLFSMTAGAGDYTMGAMLSSTLSAYLHSLRWFVFMAAGLMAGYIAFSLPALRRFSGLLRAGYIAGILVLIRFFYGQGMFTVNYRDYWCMFEWGMQFVLLSVIVLLLSVTGALRATPEERFIAMMGLILILILPLGSNNYTFPLLNNLFLIAPISLWMLRKSLLQVAGMRRGRAGKEGARIVSGRLFAVSAMAFAILCMALLQGALFHVSYAFRDGTDGTR
ncbi:MAG: hypothetical protein J6I56_05015, partial [Lachnospiraceae bacterium]|nr:hypothetical protein [Lachnospiraceae bacterium]